MGQCTNPGETKEGVRFGCRKCDACVGARIADWVARAMAERANWSHSLVLSLTYDDDALGNAELAAEATEAAKFFMPRHIRLLLVRLRRQLAYHHKVSDAVAFLAAGEQGDRRKRNHWHVVLFTDFDLTQVGTWHAKFGEITGRPEKIISPAKRGLNCKWSLWPWGYVVAQAPDEGGMRYALAYALKDQFNVENAYRTRRATKADLFPVSEFKMSKRPPIGWRFLENYLERCELEGVVPPSVSLSVPGLSYQWQPRGLLRKMLLAGLADINDAIQSATGRNAAGWSSLVHQCRESDTDLEALRYGLVAQSREETEEAFADELAQIGVSQRDRAEQQRRRHYRRRCGSTEACKTCLSGFDENWLFDHYQIRRQPERWGDFYRGEECPETIDAFKARQKDRARNEPHPLCFLNGSGTLRRSFPNQSAG